MKSRNPFEDYKNIFLAMESKIANTRVKLSPGKDSLIVNYDLQGRREAFNLELEIQDHNDRIIHPLNISGDIGNGIKPGKEKSIFWDMKSDGMDLNGSLLKVRINGNIFIPETGQKKTWIPWIYIAGGASAVTGTYAYIRANHLYQNYTVSSNTVTAENIHARVERNLNVTRVAYGATAILGVAGVLIHIRHNRNKGNLAFNYLPLKDIHLLALTYKF